MNIPLEFQKLMPVEEVFQFLQYKKNHLGCYEKNYGGLELSACPWIIGYAIVGFFKTNNSIGVPEFRVPAEVEPIELLATIYSLWRRSYQGEPPVELLLGKEHYENKKNIQKLLPPKPTLGVDREFFRFCIGFIEKHNDWSKSDYDIEFSYSNNQLAISANKTKIFCPAIGSWIGMMKVSGRQFFRSLPKRFNSNVVAITADPKYIQIESHRIPASWIDSE